MPTSKERSIDAHHRDLESCIRYAAYGSNLHPTRLIERTPSARLLGTSCLPDWSLRFHKRSLDQSGKCDIIAGTGGIHVAVYELSDADKTTLDEIEGVGAGYVDISLTVPGMGECKSYVAEESFVDNSLTPYDWYKALVLVGARAHSFPAKYVSEIEAVVACQDPDPQRSADNWAIIERAKMDRKHFPEPVSVLTASSDYE